MSSEGEVASGMTECPQREERLEERLDTCHDLAEGSKPDTTSIKIFIYLKFLFDIYLLVKFAFFFFYHEFSTLYIFLIYIRLPSVFDRLYSWT